MLHYIPSTAGLLLDFGKGSTGFGRRCTTLRHTVRINAVEDFAGNLDIVVLKQKNQT